MKFEQERFSETYEWLHNSMGEAFFKALKPEWIGLILHTLVHFELSGFFAKIQLLDAIIVLALETNDVDLRILKAAHIEGQVLCRYTSFVSNQPWALKSVPLVSKERLLRIALIEFAELKNSAKSFEKAAADKKESLLAQALQNAAWITHLETIAGPPSGTTEFKLQIAYKNVFHVNWLYHIAEVVFDFGLQLKSVNVSFTTHPEATLLELLLQKESSLLDKEALVNELQGLSFFEADLIDTKLVSNKMISRSEAALLRAIASFVHQLLHPLDRALYTLDNIIESLARHPELGSMLAQAFHLRFHPSNRDVARFEKMRVQFFELVEALDTGQPFFDRRRKKVLSLAMFFIEHVLKTNFYTQTRAAIGFRIDPSLLKKTTENTLFSELPFGIFYFFASDWIGFHTRFQDLSRGGLRTIFADSLERMIAEVGNAFTECYQLALTQQAKNKDIPEGGSKGVIFAKGVVLFERAKAHYKKDLQRQGVTGSELEERVKAFSHLKRQEYLFSCQQGYITAFLSLIHTDDKGKLEREIVDYYGRAEEIYLGPDENMSNEMIEWIAHESVRRGYVAAHAFITGKRRGGIGHKEYGVTSKGVAVYIDALLEPLGIDSKQDIFTVKMTGGPDGDVAGNLILNLYQRYGTRARIVALTDVSGTIFDEKGLDYESLISLFRQEKPIRFYPPDKLNEGGFLLDRFDMQAINPLVTQTGCYRKSHRQLEKEYLSGSVANTLYRLNVHQRYADIFAPCGGRPATLSKESVKEFIDKNGMATARAIVEGANLYLTPEARQQLEALGVMIIKDSSANKGGVISSSFEVLFDFLFDENEFETLREPLSKGVIERIEQLCKKEAKLLLETYQSHGISMSELSDGISKRILLFTHQILQHVSGQYIEEGRCDKLWLEVFLNYFPEWIAKQFPERLLQRIPLSHKQAIIAANVAAYVVYERGLDYWPSIVDSLSTLMQEVIFSKT